MFGLEVSHGENIDVIESLCRDSTLGHSGDAGYQFGDGRYRECHALEPRIEVSIWLVRSVKFVVIEHRQQGQRNMAKILCMRQRIQLSPFGGTSFVPKRVHVFSGLPLCLRRGYLFCSWQQSNKDMMGTGEGQTFLTSQSSTPR